MADLQRAFLSLPPVTRTLLAGTAVVTVPPLLALVSPYQLIWHWPAIRYKFQLYRIITPFFYAGGGLAALFNVFFLFRTANDLETGSSSLYLLSNAFSETQYAGVYARRSHDLAWALTCMAGMIVVRGLRIKQMHAQG